jgi:hypothetical protein
MAEPQEGKKRVGWIRRVAGLLLIVLGLGYWVWMARFWALYGSRFEQDTWIRFVFIIWLGTVLALVGCWLAFRSKIAAWAAGILVLATVVYFATLFVSHVS